MMPQSTPFPSETPPATTNTASRQAGMVFSLVAPVSNEEATIPHFSARIVAIMDQLGEPCELLLVREGKTSFKVLTASLFYHLLVHLSTVPIPREVGDFRLLERRVVDVLVGQRSRGRLRGTATRAS